MTWLAQVVDTGNGEKQWIGSFPLPYACLSLPRCCLRVPLCGGFGAGRRARTGRWRPSQEPKPSSIPRRRRTSHPGIIITTSRRRSTITRRPHTIPRRFTTSHRLPITCPRPHRHRCTTDKTQALPINNVGIVVGARRRLGGAIGAVGAVRKPARPDRGPLICPQKIHHPFLATGRACARPPPPGPTTRPPPRPYHWPYRLKKRAGSPATILNTVQPRSHLRRVAMPHRRQGRRARLAETPRLHKIALVGGSARQAIARQREQILSAFGHHGEHLAEAVPGALRLPLIEIEVAAFIESYSDHRRSADLPRQLQALPQISFGVCVIAPLARKQAQIDEQRAGPFAMADLPRQHQALLEAGFGPRVIA